MNYKKLEKLAEEICKLDQGDMDRVFQILMERWNFLHPDYVLLLASVPRNDSYEQKRLVEYAIQMIDAQAEF